MSGYTYRGAYKTANDPDHWRLRAEEARVVADSFSNAVAREHMLSVARSFERLAMLAEQGELQPAGSRAGL